MAEVIISTLRERFTEHGPEQERVFLKCDLCKIFKSPWDERFIVLPNICGIDKLFDKL